MLGNCPQGFYWNTILGGELHVARVEGHQAHEVE
jgi:hypothetical protein